MSDPNKPAAAAPTPLPPMMAIAIEELQKALNSPPSMGDQWPFKDPPAVLAARAARNATPGRKTDVKPNQVVRLMRFLRLGYSLRESAKRADLKFTTAHRIRAGQHSMSHHPAVTAAGVYLPPMKPKAEGQPQ